jgi:hypothetical protein
MYDNELQIPTAICENRELQLYIASRLRNDLRF